MEKLFTIPIYDCILRIVVAKDIHAARKKHTKLFGEAPEPDYNALCSYSGGHNFALFFSREAAQDLTVIAHEVFHLTHRVMEWAGCNFDRDHHEQGALLNGYLMKLVVRALHGTPKVTVKRK